MTSFSAQHSAASSLREGDFERVERQRYAIIAKVKAPTYRVSLDGGYGHRGRREWVVVPHSTTGMSTRMGPRPLKGTSALARKSLETKPITKR